MKENENKQQDLDEQKINSASQSQIPLTEAIPQYKYLKQKRKLHKEERDLLLFNIMFRQEDDDEEEKTDKENQNLQNNNAEITKSSHFIALQKDKFNPQIIKTSDQKRNEKEKKFTQQENIIEYQVKQQLAYEYIKENEQEKNQELIKQREIMRLTKKEKQQQQLEYQQQQKDKDITIQSQQQDQYIDFNNDFGINQYQLRNIELKNQSINALQTPIYEIDEESGKETVNQQELQINKSNSEIELPLYQNNQSQLSENNNYSSCINDIQQYQDELPLLQRSLSPKQINNDKIDQQDVNNKQNQDQNEISEYNEKVFYKESQNDSEQDLYSSTTMKNKSQIKQFIRQQSQLFSIQKQKSLPQSQSQSKQQIQQKNPFTSAEQYHSPIIPITITNELKFQYEQYKKDKMKDDQSKKKKQQQQSSDSLQQQNQSVPLPQSSSLDLYPVEQINEYIYREFLPPISVTDSIQLSIIRMKRSLQRQANMDHLLSSVSSSIRDNSNIYRKQQYGKAWYLNAQKWDHWNQNNDINNEKNEGKKKIESMEKLVSGTGGQQNDDGTQLSNMSLNTYEKIRVQKLKKEIEKNVKEREMMQQRILQEIMEDERKKIEEEEQKRKHEEDMKQKINDLQNNKQNQTNLFITQDEQEKEIDIKKDQIDQSNQSNQQYDYYINEQDIDWDYVKRVGVYAGTFNGIAYQHPSQMIYVWKMKEEAKLNEHMKQYKSYHQKKKTNLNLNETDQQDNSIEQAPLNNTNSYIPSSSSTPSPLLYQTQQQQQQQYLTTYPLQDILPNAFKQLNQQQYSNNTSQKQFPSLNIEQINQQQNLNAILPPLHPTSQSQTSQYSSSSIQQSNQQSLSQTNKTIFSTNLSSSSSYTQPINDLNNNLNINKQQQNPYIQQPVIQMQKNKEYKSPYNQYQIKQQLENKLIKEQNSIFNQLQTSPEQQIKQQLIIQQQLNETLMKNKRSYSSQDNKLRHFPPNYLRHSISQSKISNQSFSANSNDINNQTNNNLPQNSTLSRSIDSTLTQNNINSTHRSQYDTLTQKDIGSTLRSLSSISRNAPDNALSNTLNNIINIQSPRQKNHQLPLLSDVSDIIIQSQAKRSLAASQMLNILQQPTLNKQNKYKVKFGQKFGIENAEKNTSLNLPQFSFLSHPQIPQIVFPHIIRSLNQQLEDNNQQQQNEINEEKANDTKSNTNKILTDNDLQKLIIEKQIQNISDVTLSGEREFGRQLDLSRIKENEMEQKRIKEGGIQQKLQISQFKRTLKKKERINKLFGVQKTEREKEIERKQNVVLQTIQQDQAITLQLNQTANNIQQLIQQLNSKIIYKNNQDQDDEQFSIDQLKQINTPLSQFIKQYEQQQELIMNDNPNYGKQRIDDLIYKPGDVDKSEFGAEYQQMKNNIQLQRQQIRKQYDLEDNEREEQEIEQEDEQQQNQEQLQKSNENYLQTQTTKPETIPQRSKLHRSLSDNEQRIVIPPIIHNQIENAAKQAQRKRKEKELKNEKEKEIEEQRKLEEIKKEKEEVQQKKQEMLDVGNVEEADKIERSYQYTLRIRKKQTEKQKQQEKLEKEMQNKKKIVIPTSGVTMNKIEIISDQQKQNERYTDSNNQQVQNNKINEIENEQQQSSQREQQASSSRVLRELHKQNTSRSHSSGGMESGRRSVLLSEIVSQTAQRAINSKRFQRLNQMMEKQLENEKIIQQQQQNEKEQIRRKHFKDLEEKYKGYGGPNATAVRRIERREDSIQKLQAIGQQLSYFLDAVEIQKKRKKLCESTGITESMAISLIPDPLPVRENKFFLIQFPKIFSRMKESDVFGSGQLDLETQKIIMQEEQEKQKEEEKEKEKAQRELIISQNEQKKIQKSLNIKSMHIAQQQLQQEIKQQQEKDTKEIAQQRWKLKQQSKNNKQNELNLLLFEMKIRQQQLKQIEKMEKTKLLFLQKDKQIERMDKINIDVQKKAKEQIKKEYKDKEQFNEQQFSNARIEQVLREAEQVRKNSQPKQTNILFEQAKNQLEFKNNVAGLTIQEKIKQIKKKKRKPIIISPSHKEIPNEQQQQQQQYQYPQRTLSPFLSTNRSRSSSPSLIQSQQLSQSQQIQQYNNLQISPSSRLLINLSPTQRHIVSYNEKLKAIKKNEMNKTDVKEVNSYLEFTRSANYRKKLNKENDFKVDGRSFEDENEEDDQLLEDIVSDEDDIDEKMLTNTERKQLQQKRDDHQMKVAKMKEKKLEKQKRDYLTRQTMEWIANTSLMRGQPKDPWEKEQEMIKNRKRIIKSRNKSKSRSQSPDKDQCEEEKSSPEMKERQLNTEQNKVIQKEQDFLNLTNKGFNKLVEFVGRVTLGPNVLTSINETEEEKETREHEEEKRLAIQKEYEFERQRKYREEQKMMKRLRLKQMMIKESNQNITSDDDIDDDEFDDSDDDDIDEEKITQKGSQASKSFSMLVFDDYYAEQQKTKKQKKKQSLK